MKRIIYIFLGLLTGLSAYAQPGAPKGRQRIEAAKVAFITQKLDLSPEEAQQFWPLYNNYQRDAEGLIKQRNLSRKNNGEAPGMDNEIEFKSRMLDIQKRYHTQFTRILPQKKAFEVFKAEREFRQQLIKELGQRGHRGGPANSNIKFN